MLKAHTKVVTAIAQNSRVLECTETKECVIIDPGGEAQKILKVVKDNGLTLKAIWLTHSHLDHCGGVKPILDEFVVPLVAHPGEQVLRANVVSSAQMFGLPASEWHNCPEPTQHIVGGEKLSFGKLSADVLFTPGHSPGHVSFYFADDSTVISGDALFEGSIGRTDLPGGNHEMLIRSIKEKLLSLPDDTAVLSGHGGDTTIGREKRTNPYVANTR
jgi:hydroxyacylglutathione hydrolase